MGILSLDSNLALVINDFKLRDIESYFVRWLFIKSINNCIQMAV